MNPMSFAVLGRVCLMLVVTAYLGFFAWTMATSTLPEQRFSWLLPVSAALVLVLAVVARHLSLVARVNQSPPSKWINAAETSYTRALNQALLRGSLSARVVMDEAGRIVECNDALCELVGYSESELIGADMANMFIPERYIEAHRAGMEKYLRSGEGPVIDTRTEIEMLISGGLEIPIELTVSVVHGSPKKYFAAEIRDLRERRAIEQDLRSAKEAAEAANQAQGLFLASMSHEIRTPLNAVLGIVKLMRRGVDEHERQRLLDTAEKSGSLLLNVVNDVLDYSKIEAGAMFLTEDAFSLPELVTETVGLYQPIAAEKGLQVVAECDPACAGYVLGDRSKIAQILNNLVSNAVKFTDTGSVTVNLQQIGKASNGKEYRLSVTDTGIGVEADQLETIFDVFAQVEYSDTRKHYGSGLGLAISRQLAALMNGKLIATSTMGKGSTFSLTLTLADSEKHSTAGAEDERPASGAETLPILLVEDSPANQLIVRIALERVGYRVVVASDGVEACERLREPGAYGLVLTDIQMPHMNGLELVRWIREAGMTVPVVALTAKAFKEDQETCFAAGMNDFLSKPIDIDLLESTVARWVASSQGQRLARSPLADRLQQMFPNEQEFNEALDIVCSELNTLASELSQMIDQGNLDELDEVVHKLKGIAANYQLRSLETVCKAYETTEAPQRLERAQAVVQGVVAVLTTTEAGNPNPGPAQPSAH